MFKDIVINLLIVILCIILPIVAIISFASWVDAESCKAKSVSFEDYDYGIFQGCMVLHEGRWLPLENIRYIEE